MLRVIGQPHHQPQPHPIPYHHQPRPHYHHRSHGAPIASAIVGGLALASTAATIAALSQPPPPRYIVVNPPTSEEEKEAQRLKNAERQAEINRKIEEANNIRLKNQQIQEQMESTRCANYQLHMQLINEADILPYDTLKARILALGKLEEPISRFQSSPFKGMPEFNGRNLLGCLLFNVNLAPENKHELLNIILFNLSYSRYYLKLFQQPLLEHMLNQTSLLDVLSNLYINMYLQSSQYGINVESERTIWSRLIALDVANAYKLFNLINTDERKYQLLTDWIHSRTTATDVLSAYQTIKQYCHLSDYTLAGFFKMAKQQVLYIELMNVKNQPGMVLHPGEKVDDVHNFLETHRNGFSSMFSCFFKPRSVRINNLIETGQVDDATKAWGAEYKSEQNGFYRAVGVR